MKMISWDFGREFTRDLKAAKETEPSFCRLSIRIWGPRLAAQTTGLVRL